MITELEIRKFLDFNFGQSKKFKGTKCEIELELATDFHHRIILSGYSLYYIFFPRPNDIFENLTKRAVTIDFPSTYTLLRVIFEAYVNSYYLLFGSNEREENLYKILRWNIHELKERLKLAETIKSNNPQIEEIKDDLEKLKNELYKNNYFNEFSNSIKRDIINSNRWSKKTVTEKVKCTDIHPTISDYIYKYTSNYIHCDPISLAQLHFVKSQNEIDTLLNLPKILVLMFTALSLEILTKLSDEIKGEVENNKKVNDTIILYKSLSKLKIEDIANV